MVQAEITRNPRTPSETFEIIPGGHSKYTTTVKGFKGVYFFKVNAFLIHEFYKHVKMITKCIDSFKMHEILK